MNKNMLIGVLVVIILVLGWMAYSPKAKAPENVVATNTETNTTSTGTNTFHSLFNQPGSHTCTFEKVQISPSSKASNVIYVADGKMRGEFRTQVGTKITSTLMVYNNGILYVWNEGTGTGTKTQLKTIADLPVAIPTDLTSGKVLGSSSDNVSWDCHDWIKDSKILVPPSTVKFY